MRTALTECLTHSPRCHEVLVSRHGNVMRARATRQPREPDDHRHFRRDIVNCAAARACLARSKAKHSMRYCVRLSPPSALTVISLVALSLLATWPLLDLTYTVIRYGTELTPDSGGYNFPPQACFPPFILLSILGPLTLISRLRIAAIVILAIVGLAVMTSLFVVMSVLADLIAAPQSADALKLSVLGLTAGMVLPAIPIARWVRGQPTPRDLLLADRQRRT